MRTTGEIVRHYGFLTKTVRFPAGTEFRVATDASGVSGIIGWIESHEIPREAALWPFPFPVYREDVDVETATRARRIQRRAAQ